MQRGSRLGRIAGLIVCAAQFLAAGASADDTNAALRYWTVWSVTFPNVAEIWEGVPKADFGDPDAVFDDAALAMLSRHENEINALRRASALRRFDIGMEWSEGPYALLPHLSKVRNSGNLLLAHARVSFDRGDAAEGSRSLAAAIRLAEQNSQDGVVISSLVSMAVFAQCEKLLAYAHERGALDADGCRRVASALGTFTRQDPFRTGLAIEHERAHFIGWIRREAQSNDPDGLLQFFAIEVDANKPSDGALAGVAHAITSGEGLDAMLDQLDECMALFIDAWRLPDPSVVVTPLMERVRRGEFGAMATVLTASYPKIVEQRARAEALLAGAKAVVAADH